MNKNHKKNNNKYKKQNKKELVINLEDSQSDIDNKFLKPICQQKSKMLKNKNEKNILLGQKHKLYFEQNSKENKFMENDNEFNKKKSKISNDNPFIFQNDIENSSLLYYYNNDNIENIPRIDNNNIKNDKKLNKNRNKSPYKNKNKEINENENILVFPYEFTERMIDALSCLYCGGIYIKPYVINVKNCGHIFCLGCIIKMLGDKEITECFLCKNLFNQENIKYSEITDFYIKFFFPQITQIIEENQKQLNYFIETEAKKYYESNKNEEKKIILRFELKPFKENILPQNKLPTIHSKSNKFMINIKSENENVISIIKKEVIKRLNLHLKEKDIEIRIQGIEVSQLQTFKLLKNYLSPNLEEIFYYSKKGKK